MSEYPCTGIDKAILKFELQDRKISQIVSVNFSIFFRYFFDIFSAFFPAIVTGLHASAAFQGPICKAL
jgi:hypothetical protein